jgi:hypothetical protein
MVLHQENQIGWFTAIRSNGAEEVIVVMQDFVADTEIDDAVAIPGRIFFTTGRGLDVVRIEKGKYQIVVDGEVPTLLTSDDPRAV